MYVLIYLSIFFRYFSHLALKLFLECLYDRYFAGPEEAQRLQRFWPWHHLAFKFLNLLIMLTCHVMCLRHELLCILVLCIVYYCVFLLIMIIHNTALYCGLWVWS